MSPAETTIPQSWHRVTSPRLRLVVEREQGVVTHRETIAVGPRLRVGSHASNDLVVTDAQVSRFHFELDRPELAWLLRDVGSLNGTRISGVRIRDCDLPSECVIELGDSLVRVVELPEDGEERIPSTTGFGDLVGRSPAMQRLFALVGRVAASDANVLIEGESGTCKELVAMEIVRRGARALKPFVVVDCGSISPQLIESELFGHVRGAFTGADRERVGAFEAAHGGTVLLDEIGEMPLELQPKLLRVLESKEIRRVGETKPRKVDVRVLAATNRRLEREVNQQRFREDLYFRLSVVTVRNPPLRERREDIAFLIDHFLEAFGAGKARALFTKSVLADLVQHEWPGNVRELRNYVERSVVLNAAAWESERTSERTEVVEVTPRSSAPPSANASANVVSLALPFRAAKEMAIEHFEREYLASLMKTAEGNVSRAARDAKMDRMNLHRLLQRYGLKAR